MFFTLAQNTSTMQEDKNLFTEKVPAGKRTYFIDVLQNHKGHKYIKFTESRLNEGEFIRQSLRIYQEDFDKIFEAFENVKQFVGETSANGN